MLTIYSNSEIDFVIFGERVPKWLIGELKRRYGKKIKIYKANYLEFISHTGEFKFKFDKTTKKKK